MTMQMKRAFNSKMLTRLYLHTLGAGSYNADNEWVEGVNIRTRIWAVIVAGNKFSQFEEGVARRVEDGGYRLSDFKSLYVVEKYALAIEDKLEFKGEYFKVLQESDESIFGFRSYLLEKSKEWNPV